MRERVTVTVVGRAKRAPHWGVQSRFRVIGERAKRARHSLVCSIENRGYIYYWASEASPTLGCSIEISRDICMSVCLSWSKKRRRKYVGQTRACSKSVLCGKIRPVTPVLLISTIRYSSFSMDGRETFT